MLKGFKSRPVVFLSISFLYFVLGTLLQSAVLFAADGDYELIAQASKGNKDFGIYYSSAKGEFLYKQVSHRNRHNSGFAFPRNLVSADQGLGSNGYKLKKNKRYSAHTLHQFDKSYRELLGDLNDHQVYMGTQIIAPHREKLVEHMRDFIKIKSEPHGNKVRVAYYNFKTGEIVYQELENKNGSTRVKDEKFYDLKNWDQYLASRRLLKHKGLLHETRVDDMRSVLVGPCGQNAFGVDLNINFKDFDNISDALFKQYLKNALSEKAVPVDGRKLIVKANILDKEYQLKVSYDEYGKIENVEFVNENLARQNGVGIETETDSKGAKHFLLRAVDPSDDEMKTWMAVTDDEVRQTGSGPQGRLVLSVRGKREGEFSYNGFEKSFYDVNFDSGLGRINSAGPRVRLTGDDRNSYEMKVSDGGSGGFLGLLFKVFYGQGGRHEMVKEKISEEAGKAILSNKNFKHLTNQTEINGLAEKIARNVKLRTNNYTTSLGKIEAVAAEESYGAFAELLLRRNVASLLSEEKRSDLDDIVNKTLSDFKKCMREGSDRRNKGIIEKCMLVFEKEAPVDLGRAVMDLKLTQNDMGDLRPMYVREYNKCISERYDPLFENPRPGEIVDGQDVVKGCVFQTLLITIDQGVESQLDKRMAELDTGDGPKIILSPDTKQSALQVAGRCFQRKGLMGQGSYQLNFDFNYLSNIDPTKFEHDLGDCVDEVTLNVGRVVTKTSVEHQVREVFKPEGEEPPMENLEAVVEGISTHAILNGYEYCVRKQRQLIRRAKDAYQKEKEELVNAAIDPNRVGNPTTYVPSFDPESCRELITSVSVEKSSMALIKDKLGSEKWKTLVEEADPVPAFVSCYRDHQADLKRNFERNFAARPYYQSYPPERRDEEKKKHEAHLAVLSEKKNAACLRKTVVWSSYHLAGDMLAESLEEMKEDLGGIELSRENLNLLAAKIHACFKVEMKAYETVESVGDAVDPVSNKCAMNMIKKEKVFKDLVLKPVMITMLGRAGLEGEETDRYAETLVADLRDFLESEKVGDLDQFKEKAGEYKTRGILRVVGMVLEDSVEEQFEGVEAAELAEIRSELKLKINDLIYKGEDSFEQKFKVAGENKDPEATKRIIGELKIEATRIVAGKVLEKEKENLEKDEILKSPADLNEFTGFAKGRLNKCLDGIDKNDYEKVDDKITSCTQDLKEGSINWIVDKRFTAELEDPSLTELLSKGELNTLKGRVINDEFKRRVREVSRIEDKDQAVIALDLLVSDLSVDGVKLIATKVLPKTLEKVMEVPKDSTPSKAYAIRLRRDQISSEVIRKLNGCMDRVKRDGRANIEGKPDIKLENGQPFDSTKANNNCLNKTRLDTARDVLKFKYEQGMDFVDLDSSARRSIISEKIDEFNTCTKKIDSYQESKLFQSEAEACLANNALAFVRRAVLHGRQMAGNLLRPSVATMTSFDQCLVGMRKNAIDHLKKFDPNDRALGELIRKEPSLDESEFIRQAVLVSDRLKRNTKVSLKPIGSEWVTGQVKNCFFDNLAGNILVEFQNGLFANPRYNLNNVDKENIRLLVSGFSDILKMPGPDDGHVRISNNSAREPESSTRGGRPAPREGSPNKTTIDTIRELIPTIVDYFKLVGDYNSSQGTWNLKLLLARIKDKVRLQGGNIDLQEIIDVTMESELMDDIIRAVISKEVKVTAEKALRSFIPNRAERLKVANKLSSKAMINRIFSPTDAKAKRILKNIKTNYIKKLMNGEIDSSEGIPTDVMNQVKVHLASDTKMGGFAETVLAPIAQSELSEAKGTWSSGFGRVIGRVGSRDFQWSNLKYRPGGQNVVNRFSSNILQPLLIDALSDKQLETRKSQLSDLITNVVKDNGEDYNPFW